MKNHPPDYTRNCITRIRNEAMRIKGATDVCHINPRAYCIAKPASCCAVFVIPPQDNEPQVPNNTGELIQSSDAGKVKIGDWCSLAYVCTPGISQTRIILINGKPLKKP